jgi:Domain of unknown function (DUF4279)
MPGNLDTVKAKLTIISYDLSPEEIAQRVGLHWDDSCRRGDRKGRTEQTWEENVWRLYESLETQGDGLSVDLAVDECLRRLFERIGPVAGRIRTLSETETVELGLYILATSVPPIHLSVGTLSFIYRLGAELDVDVVIYSEEAAAN